MHATICGRTVGDDSSFYSNSYRNTFHFLFRKVAISEAGAGSGFLPHSDPYEGVNSYLLQIQYLKIFLNALMASRDV